MPPTLPQFLIVGIEAFAVKRTSRKRRYILIALRQLIQPPHSLFWCQVSSKAAASLFFLGRGHDQLQFRVGAKLLCMLG